MSVWLTLGDAAGETVPAAGRRNTGPGDWARGDRQPLADGVSMPP